MTFQLNSVMTAVSERLDDQLYVTANYLLMMLPVLDDLNIDYASFFGAYDIDFARLDDMDYRISERQTSGIWQHLEMLTRDESIGLKCGRYANPKNFHILGPALWFTRTPQEGLETLLRYFRLFTDVASFSLLRVQSGYRMQAKIKPGIRVSDTNADAFISSLVTICRQLYGYQFAPTKVKVFRKQLKDAGYHQRFFRCPVETDSNVVELMFDKDTLEQESNLFSGIYSGMNNKALEDNLHLLDSEQFTFQVNVLIKRFLASGDTLMHRVCGHLHISERTLQRRLSQENMSFRELTENCRKELALQYIKQSDLSLTDISHNLGFSSYNNFSRAFKRWYGQTPRHLRDNGG